MEFEWDPEKNKKNYKKHGVVFVEEKKRIRIISARKLTSAERRRREQGQFNN